MQSDPHNVVLDEVNVDQSQQKTPNVKTTERTNLPSVRQSERAKRLARRREIRQQKMTEMTETSEGDTTEAGGDDSDKRNTSKEISVIKPQPFCCSHSQKDCVVYFTQTTAIGFIMIWSMYMLSTMLEGDQSRDLYVTLLASTVGVFLPTPRLGNKDTFK